MSDAFVSRRELLARGSETQTTNQRARKFDRQPELVEKANPYHDATGAFTSKEKSKTTSGGGEDSHHTLSAQGHDAEAQRIRQAQTHFEKGSDQHKTLESAAQSHESARSFHETAVGDKSGTHVAAANAESERSKAHTEAANAIIKDRVAQNTTNEPVPYDGPTDALVPNPRGITEANMDAHFEKYKQQAEAVHAGLPTSSRQVLDAVGEVTGRAINPQTVRVVGGKAGYLENKGLGSTAATREFRSSMDKKLTEHGFKKLESTNREDIYSRNSTADIVKVQVRGSGKRTNALVDVIVQRHGSSKKREVLAQFGFRR